MIGKDEELVEMAKLTCLIREKATTTFISDWKPLMKKEEKNEPMIYGFKG